MIAKDKIKRLENGVQQRVLQYWGRSNTHQHWFAIGHRFGQKFFNVAFCSYLHLQYFNWAAVPGGRISNPTTSQSPIVGCYIFRNAY
jgi:hypothetical protein